MANLASISAGWKVIWRIGGLLALMAVLAAAGWWANSSIRKDERAKVVGEYADQAAVIVKKREAIAAPIVAKEAAVQVQIRTITKTLIEKVPFYATTNDCPAGLSADFSRLHNAAAANAIIPNTTGKPATASAGTAAVAH